MEFYYFQDCESPKDTGGGYCFLPISDEYMGTFCPFCGERLDSWKAREEHYDDAFGDLMAPTEYGLYSQVKLCAQCGWWNSQYLDMAYVFRSQEVAILKKFAIGADTAPLCEIRRILSADWKYSKHVSAQRAEDLVASVFKEHLDCEVHYLSNSVFAKDGGVDFVLVSRSSGKTSAFQVKRRQTDKPEPIKEVRAFLGALACSQWDTGFYVTTAERFTKDVEATMRSSSKRLKRRNLDLKLVDGRQLGDLLRLQAPDIEAMQQLRSAFVLSDNWWYNHTASVVSIPESGGVSLNSILESCGKRKPVPARKPTLRTSSAVPWWQSIVDRGELD